MADETPPTSIASKWLGVDSSTISLSVQPTKREFEQQQKQEKSTEDSSVDLMEPRRREHERVLQTRKDCDEDNDRRERELTLVREAEASALEPSTGDREENKEVNVNLNVTNEKVGTVTTRSTPHNQETSNQPIPNHQIPNLAVGNN